MKEHQEYLMKLIDEKNRQIGQQEVLNVDLHTQLEEQKKRSNNGNKEGNTKPCLRRRLGEGGSY